MTLIVEILFTNLEKGSHGTEAVPEHGGEITDHLPLLAELQQGSFSGVGRGELYDPLVDLLPVNIGLGGGGGGRRAGGGGRAGHRAAGHLQTQQLSRSGPVLARGGNAFYNLFSATEQYNYQLLTV